MCKIQILRKMWEKWRKYETLKHANAQKKEKLEDYKLIILGPQTKHASMKLRKDRSLYIDT